MSTNREHISIARHIAASANNDRLPSRCILQPLMHRRGSDVMIMHLVLPPHVKRPNALVATTASEAQPSLTVRHTLVLRQRVMCIPLCDKPCHSQAFAGGQAEAQGLTKGFMSAYIHR